MDPLDHFYQHLDSKALLDRHGPELVADARDILARDPAARIAGLITLPDSCDAAPIRDMLARLTGQPVPAGLLVGVVPRHAVEALLSAHVEEDVWKEQPWQPQNVLPVVVSTRDGFRFGFFGLATAGAGEA